MKRNNIKCMILTFIVLTVASCTSDSDILTTEQGDVRQMDQADPSASTTPTLDQRLRGVWIIGGTDGTDIISEVDLYDPATDTWFSNVSTFSSPRKHFAIASGLGKIYLFGGITTGPPIDKVDIFDPETMQWSSGTVEPINNATEVRGAGAVYSHGRFFLMGGHDGAIPLQQYHEYNPASDTWTQRNGATGIAQDREDFAYCNLMGSAANIGGRDNTTIRNYNYHNYTSFDYNDYTGETVLPVALFGGSAQSLGRVVYFTGGSNSYTIPAASNKFYSYDVETNVWTTRPSMSQGRYYHGSALVNGILYVFGGTIDHTGTSALDSVEAVESYDVVNEIEWTAKTSMPRARYGFGATTVTLH